jgi:hypothetical protein
MFFSMTWALQKIAFYGFLLVTNYLGTRLCLLQNAVQGGSGWLALLLIWLEITFHEQEDPPVCTYWPMG